MLDRAIQPLLRRRLSEYPAVALVGPRQSGKTTAARRVGGQYYDLEQPGDRLRLDLEWDVRVRSREMVILDEAQAYPEIFPRLRGAIDERRGIKGRFLLLGSVAPSLMSQVSESLAGRLSIVELTPLLWGELPDGPGRARLWLCGGFPEGGVLRARRYPQWQLDYTTLIAQRDLPSWGLPARPQVTQRLMRMLAASHGQILNASQFGASLGVSYHTIRSYLDHFEAAFLVRRLPPYSANIGKRLIKSPKIQWRDSGIVHALLHVSDSRRLLDQPWVGASWESFVIEQILGALSTRGVPHEAYFLRTSDGHEIDLVIECAGQRWSFEIKLTTTPGSQDLARLDQGARWINSDRCILLTRSKKVSLSASGRQVACDLSWLLDHLPGWL